MNLAQRKTVAYIFHDLAKGLLLVVITNIFSENDNFINAVSPIGTALLFILVSLQLARKVHDNVVEF